MTTLAGRLMNAVPTWILGSPLHPLMSSRYLLLTFTGRRTGRLYTTPVAYVQHGPQLLISTDSPWGANVIDGRQVTVRLRGRVRSGIGRRLDEPEQSTAAMQELLTIPGYARAAGVAATRGRVSTEQAAWAAARRTVVAIELGGAA